MCVGIFNVTPLALRDFSFGPMMFVLNNCFLAFIGVSFVASIGVRVFRRCERGKIAGIKFRAQFSVMVNVYCCMLIMSYGPSAIESNLLHVGLCVVLKVFVPPATGVLSTNTNSFILKTGAWRMRLVVTVLVSLLRLGHSTVNLLSHVCQSFQKAATQYATSHIAG